METSDVSSLPNRGAQLGATFPLSPLRTGAGGRQCLTAFELLSQSRGPGPGPKGMVGEHSVVGRERGWEGWVLTYEEAGGALCEKTHL